MRNFLLEGACGLGTRLKITEQRRRKDFLIGRGDTVFNNCSTGHIEWAWHKLKTLGVCGECEAQAAQILTCSSHPSGFYTYAEHKDFKKVLIVGHHLVRQRERDKWITCQL